MQKISSKVSYRYREIVKKNRMILLSYDVNGHVYSQVVIHPTSYGFSQYGSHTNFDIKSVGNYTDICLEF